jgi:hypothetical protein
MPEEPARDALSGVRERRFSCRRAVIDTEDGEYHSEPCSVI